MVAALIESGHDVIEVESSAQVTTRLARGPVDILIVDLAGSEALKFLRKLAAQRGPIPILCVADRRRQDASSEALRLGVIDIIARPVRTGDVMAAIANAREFTRVARQAEPAPEVVEHGRLGDPGPLGHRVEGGVGVVVLDEQLEGCVDDRLLRLRPALELARHDRIVPTAPRPAPGPDTTGAP